MGTTNWVDRVPTMPNRYKITDESSGAVSYVTLERADEPTVEGTPINAVNLQNILALDSQKLNGQEPSYYENKEITYEQTTLSISGWSGNTYSFEADYPSTEYDVEVQPNNTITLDEIDAWSSAKIMGSATTNILTALGDVPIINIPVIAKVVKK